jgi:hypothetical protein
MGEAAAATTGAGHQGDAVNEESHVRELEREMDRLSLEQSLRDFEIANARVIDLTRRLLEANEQIWALQRQVEASTLRAIALKRPVAVLKQSSLGRLARRLRAVLRSLQG